ncbi:MAG: hydrogenase maturation protein [Thiobacillus sp.]|nr:hydrogenase maturation protein [Thiobacillus sp.]
MRILFLTHAFNSLTQRLYLELSRLGHEVSIEFDINDSVTIEAVDLFRPHLILAPYLRRAIPEAIWRNHLCLVLHPGIVGDRGPSALDWAILKGEQEWGVTLLQAEAEMDAGPVWASATFPLRQAKKSSVYRNEVTEAAVRVVMTALERLPDYRAGKWHPQAVPLRPMHALMQQANRAIDWAHDNTETVLAKLNAADGFPGVKDELFGHPCHLFNAHAFPARGAPGDVLGRSGEGVVRATADGAVCIGHVKRGDSPLSIKLPAAVAFPEVLGLMELAVESNPADPDIRYEEADGVGYLHFDFYNGAMGTDACRRLQTAYEAARLRPTRVIVLLGGPDFFSNGLDLNRIEAADSPPDESMRNIEAMDDLCRAVIETTTHHTVAALQGNAGAGGAFLALAADCVWAREGVILNPHYKNMGNLYGSEYWTYLLPRRVGGEAAQRIMARRLPLGTKEAVATGFIETCFGQDVASFQAEVRHRAAALADAPELMGHLDEKRARRAADEAAKPLAQYRAEELAHMKRNFYGFDPSYHVARHHFVDKTPHSWTPRHLARHRELGWVVPGDAEA